MFNNANNQSKNNDYNVNITNENQKNIARGVCSNKKNFSSFTLTHDNNPNSVKNKNIDQSYTEIKNRNNTQVKNEFAPSSSSYGAYYKIKK